jgi:hypothetical protein
MLSIRIGYAKKGALTASLLVSLMAFIDAGCTNINLRDYLENPVA